MKKESILCKEIDVCGRSVKNRIVIQPMEGCDCNLDGSPSELTENKYLSFAKSAAGVIWFEANAVCKEGRTNERQMMLTEKNAEAFKALLQRVKAVSKAQFGYEPLCILQLTHSGRQSIVPICAYHNSVYEEKRPITDDNIATDEYIDSLPSKYVASALLAQEVGFDGVDVKACHGYLFQEFLSAYRREGKYGGSLENRSRLYRETFVAVKAAVSPDFIVASRFDPSDVVPKPNGFGTDSEGNVDLTEAKILLQQLYNEGLRFVNITIGNPYYNPHVNRPFRKGAYIPPERAEEGLKRFEDVETEIKKAFPDMIFVGSGLSYYREDMMERATEQIENNVCDLVGFGRSSIAYPTFFTDYLQGEFKAKSNCLACSKCTELMRAHQVSGCAIHNEYYRNLYKQTVLSKQ